MRYRPFAIMLVMALCLLSAHAQSGRKHAKTEPAAPVPTPTPEPTPTPKKAEQDSGLSFTVGADQSDAFSNIPLSYYAAAVQGCVDRLRARSGSVDFSNRSLSRGDAIKKAKSETVSYVVLLTLKLAPAAQTADDLVVEFIVFAPGTGKIVTSGNSYTKGTRSGPVVVGTGRTSTSGLYLEKLIELAGEDAGNRIIKALHRDVDIPRSP